MISEDSGNARDLDRICSHCSRSAELWSPSVVTRWSIESGRIEGIGAIRRHFAKGLEEA